MNRKSVGIWAGIIGYGIFCGSLLALLYDKAADPNSNAAGPLVVYLLLGLCPALVVFWLPRVPWVVLFAVAVSLAVELITTHLAVGCFTAHDCVETILFSTARPFVYLYFLVSMPVSMLLLALRVRGGRSK